MSDENTTEMSPRRNDIGKTNVMLSRHDMRKMGHLMLNWDEEYEFPIPLKISHCLNAAVELIIRSSDENHILAHAKELGLKTDEEIDQLRKYYEWFMQQYLGILRENVDERAKNDKRKLR